MKLQRGEGFLVIHGAPVPKGSAAITLGNVILMRKGNEDSKYLIYHELTHVHQWANLGLVGFGSRYLRDYAVGRYRGRGHWGAYHHIRFEIEADWHARRRLRDEALAERVSV
jgi:Domain of unknown function (DUF4157)